MKMKLTISTALLFSQKYLIIHLFVSTCQFISTFLISLHSFLLFFPLQIVHIITSFLGFSFIVFGFKTIKRFPTFQGLLCTLFKVFKTSSCWNIFERENQGLEEWEKKQVKERHVEVVGWSTIASIPPLKVAPLNP